MAEKNQQNGGQQQDINQLLKVRREKLQNLQDAGKDPFVITKYDQTHHSVEVKAEYTAHEEQLLAGRPEPVVEGLDGVGIQSLLLDCSKSRLDMIADLPLICHHSKRLQAAEVGSRPRVHPLAHSRFVRRLICASINGGGGRLELLGNFLLRLASDAALDLLACAGISPRGVPCLPERVFLAVTDDGLLANCSRSLCGAGIAFSCHDYLLSEIAGAAVSKPTSAE